MKFTTTIANTSTRAPSHTPTRSSSRGQGLTEYIIIVSLVAVAAIWAASFFGDTVKANFTALGSELSGGTKYNVQQNTSAAFRKADTSVKTETTLKNYRD